MTETSELHRAVGELEGTVKSLEGKGDKLTVQVESLTAVLNQGKGAKYILFLLPAVIGARSGALGYFGFKMSLGGQ